MKTFAKSAPDAERATGSDAVTPRPAPWLGRRPWRLTLTQVWVATALLLPLVGLLKPPLSTIDLAYQIRAGQLMVGLHHILRADPFTFTVLGRSWLNQQWGAQLLFYLMFRIGGWQALVVGRAVLGSAIAFLVYLSCRAAGAERKQSAALTIAASVLCFPGFILRPQLIGMVLFAGTVWILATRSRHPRGIWFIPVIACLWANIHGSFFFAPLLVGLSYLEDRYTTRKPTRGLLLVALAATLATILNPFGLSVWPYALGISTNPQVTKTIIEWQPPTLHSGPGVLFFISAIALWSFLSRRGESTPWPYLLVLAIFFTFGLWAVRGVYWWALAAPCVAARLMSQERTALTKPERRSVLHFAFISCLALLGVALLPWWGSSRAQYSTDLIGDAPPGITAALDRALHPGERMFNPQIWGSWFEFAIPNSHVFVDSRIEVFPDGVWRDYDAVSNGAAGWEAALSRWGISLAVLSRTQQAAIIPQMLDAPDWKLIYQDSSGMIFVRTAVAS